jgi:hypothetical protein
MSLKDIQRSKAKTKVFQRSDKSIPVGPWTRESFNWYSVHYLGGYVCLTVHSADLVAVPIIMLAAVRFLSLCTN